MSAKAEGSPVAIRFAASLGLLAFAALCVRGAMRAGPFAPAVGGALVAMLVFAAIGFGIGALARNAVRESVDREIREAEQAEGGDAEAPQTVPRAGPPG